MNTLHNDTITLFNRKVGSDGDTWYPTVLRGVHVIMENAEEAAKYGPDAKDAVNVNIPYLKNDNGNITCGEKKWLPPKEWAALEDPSKAITFASGTHFDFFLVGDWGSEEIVKDSDYPDGGFYSYMEKTRDFVYAFHWIKGPFNVIPHFETVGK